MMHNFSVTAEGWHCYNDVAMLNLSPRIQAKLSKDYVYEASLSSYRCTKRYRNMGYLYNHNTTTIPVTSTPIGCNNISARFANKSKSSAWRTPIVFSLQKQTHSKHKQNMSTFVETQWAWQIHHLNHHHGNKLVTSTVRWVGCLHCVYWGETEATGEGGERTEEGREREVARKEEGEVKRLLGKERERREERQRLLE